MNGGVLDLNGFSKRLEALRKRGGNPKHRERIFINQTADTTVASTITAPVPCASQARGRHALRE